MVGALSTSSTLPAIFSLRQNTKAQNQSLVRLASGQKINSGKDDPAGLISATQLEAAIAELDAQSRVVERADANVNIADGNTGQLSSLLSDLNEKLVASANTGGLSDAEIQANQLEIDQIVTSIQKFTDDSVTSLDGFSLPDGGNQKLAAMLRSAATTVSTLATGGTNSLTSGHLEAAQSIVQDASTAIASARGTIGAFQKSTLAPRINTIAIERENLLASKSRIADTDFAVEVGNLARASLLQASSVKSLNLSRQQNAQVLNLLR